MSGDFNGDGILDIAILVSEQAAPVKDAVQILLGVGDGTFKTGATYAVGPNGISIIAGDFDGDGNQDLVVTNAGSYDQSGADSAVLLLTGNGDGTFATRPIDARLRGEVTYYYNAVAGDFNGDGKLDLVIVTPSADVTRNGIVVLLGHGDGTFDPPAFYGVDCYTVTVGDIDGDGIPDLVTTGYLGDYYLLGMGDGSFKTAAAIAIGAVQPILYIEFRKDGVAIDPGPWWAKPELQRVRG